MIELVERIRKQAALRSKTIVLPEGEDTRIVQAGVIAQEQHIANIIILGNKEEIIDKNKGIDISQVTIIDPQKYEKTDFYANKLFEIRKGKINKKTGQLEYSNIEEAKNKILNDYTMYAVLMLKVGDADGLVSGACHSTANALRPGLQIIKTNASIPLVSTCSIMVAPNENNEFCQDGVFVCSDCALNQNPTSEELGYIAISAAEVMQKVVGIEPRVALLSHSTKGSAKHADVDKVVNAYNFVKTINPKLQIDGELQFDSAIVPSVGKFKAPNSTIAGSANVLVFPDLDAANIGCKIIQRLGHFEHVGPICQGFNKPINDLSRGCSVDEVINVIALTVLQA